MNPWHHEVLRKKVKKIISTNVIVLRQGETIFLDFRNIRHMSRRGVLHTNSLD